MKKALFLIGLGFTSMMSAKDNLANKENIPKYEIRQSIGYSYQDTACCGTCFVHRTYTTIYGDNGVSLTFFEPSDSATQFVHNHCLGEGIYQV